MKGNGMPTEKVKRTLEERAWKLLDARGIDNDELLDAELKSTCVTQVMAAFAREVMEEAAKEIEGNVSLHNHAHGLCWNCKQAARIRQMKEGW